METYFDLNDIEKYPRECVLLRMDFANYNNDFP